MTTDLREAIRSFIAQPGFSLVVVLTLALAIGINSAIFSVLNGVLLRPLDYADPGRLVVVWESNPTAGQPPYRAACDCRKPKPGLLLRAASDMNLDLSRSVMIGDKPSDIAAGQRAGVASVLVLTGYGRGEWEYRRHEWTIKPDHVAEDLFDAVEWALTRVSARGSE